MTTAINYTKAQSTKVELATAVAMYLGLCERIHHYKEGSARRAEAGEAATNTAYDAMEKFGWDAWGEAINKMIDQFPNHEWSTGYAAQVVWFVQN